MALAVPVGAGDRVTIRMPSGTERQNYHLAAGEPAIEIRRPNGTVEVHGAGLIEVVFMASDPEPTESSPVAKRQRIVADVRRAVVTGGLRPGDQLPSEDQLVTRYDASRTTVRRALADIRRLGLARADRATGTWVVHQDIGQSR
jgi:Bacterial regulatory proteins, gntR family